MGVDGMFDSLPIEVEAYIQSNAIAQLLYKQNKLNLKTLTTTKHSSYNYCVVLESIDGMYFDYILCSPKMEK